MEPMKIFTVEEANNFLPKLSVMLLELQKKRDAISALELEIDVAELVAEKDESGVAQSLNGKVEEYNRAVNRFYGIIDEIHETGCVLKDVDLGLVDFYGYHKGRMVYLCWKMGEPQVSYWHEIGHGFIHRQPIAEKPAL